MASDLTALRIHNFYRIRISMIWNWCVHVVTSCSISLGMVTKSKRIKTTKHEHMNIKLTKDFLKILELTNSKNDYCVKVYVKSERAC